MKFFQNKKFQMGALFLVLIVVIVAGLWWFTHPLETSDGNENNSSFTHIGDATIDAPEGVELAGRRMTYYQVARQRHEEAFPISARMLKAMFLYKDQACCFSLTMEEEDFRVDIVSVDNGDVLDTYQADSFYQGWFADLLYMDAEGTLWTLYPDYTGEETWILANADSDKTVEIAIEKVSMFMQSGVDSFCVENRSIVLHGGAQLAVLDLDSGETHLIGEPIKAYCLDQSGNLYYYQTIADGRNLLAKYSLEKSQTLWSTNELPSVAIYGLTYTANGGLFSIGGSFNNSCEIFSIDTETGKTAWELTTLSRDLIDAPEQLLSGDGVLSFMINGAYHIYLTRTNYDLSAESQEDWWACRDLYILEPVEGEAELEDTIELVITAPVVIDSIDTAARLYQRDHPEVKFLWDTQYLSSEDLLNNFQEYKEQFALRAMAGGLGDIVMLSGFGLDTRMITNTDAFADLSKYLDACPFKEELQWNPIETLRGKDGAIRALPLGVTPTYYIWNAELVEELGIDPDTVTWSELLELAEQWKADGIDLALTAAFPGEDTVRSTYENLLQDILLANLYAAEQADGTVRLDQPYLRKLMEALKDLKGCRQLIWEQEDYYFRGSNRILFIKSDDSSRHIIDRIYDMQNIAENGEMTPRAATRPKGEENKRQQGYAYCWGLNARSEKLDATWGFLQFLISNEGFSGGLYTQNTLPINTIAQEAWANNHARDWGYYGAENEIRNYFHQLQNVVDTIYNRYDQPYGWYDAVYVPFEKYIDDELSLDEAMEEADTNWKRFLAE